jgi:hypothetical protein
LLLALMFAFGHRICDDPLFGWVRSTLEEPEMGDPNRRFERLFQRTKVYTKQMLLQLREGSA